MKYRVIDQATGEEVVVSAREVFKMDDSGQVAVHQGGHNWRRLTNYIVEFAFTKDESGAWIYENCVMHQ
jgi:hypothetical protein